MERVAAVVWSISAALVAALDEQLGAPVDSYVNGSQTWLAGDEPAAAGADAAAGGAASGDGVVLELRLHPVAGYTIPRGCSHYDVWEAVVAQLAQGVDPQALRLGEEVRPLTALWDGLEAFAAYGDDVEPARLAELATEAVGLVPDHAGLVDHEAIADAWEHARGRVSIVALLVDQLRA